MALRDSGSAPLVDAAFADAPVPRRFLIVAAARSLGVVLATLVLYSLLPIRPETAVAVAVMAGLGLVLLAILFGRQLRRISRAPRPVLAAVEALALVFGMFLTLFAFLYVSMSAADPQAFTEAVDKVAGVYFSLTILATVGFGDISAVSDPARIAVTIQMAMDLVLIGTAVKLLGVSARRAVEARISSEAPDGGMPPAVVAMVDDEAGSDRPAGPPGGAVGRS